MSNIVKGSDALAVGVQKFDSEDELYDFLESLSTDLDGVSFLDKAKAAVNAWWTRAIVGIANADAHFGYNSSVRLNRTYEMPAALREWCQKIGLDEDTKISKARNAAKTWLALNGADCASLVDEFGYSRLSVIGRAPVDKVPELISLTSSGTTHKELEKAVSRINASEEVLSRNLEEARDELVKREAAIAAYEGVRSSDIPEFKKLSNAVVSAKKAVTTYEAKLSAFDSRADSKRTEQAQSLSTPAISQSGLKASQLTKEEADTFKPAYEALQLEREEYAKKAERVVETAKQTIQEEQRKAAELEAKLKEVQEALQSRDKRIEKLKDAVSHYQDVKNVDESCLENRIQAVQANANYFAELSVTYVNVRDQVTDHWMKERCKKAIVSAWTNWIQVLPLDVLSEFDERIQVRLQSEQPKEADTLVTIDV